ncbi:FIMAH domain-containing protein [Paracerasibacillus soli]|uniref:FIMAH domain-containing protein n=1 Tax=Paracerasibacillus soli TaxID=480284 RepID=A0ABU5CSF1_9BACI|nr:hypothetical protein [Virgibacillus soli]MDY0409292.1 hypothetical protein [Virgibacillus soli]
MGQVSSDVDVLLSDVNAKSMQALVGIFAELGDIDQAAIRPFTTHLIAVERFEQQGAQDKVAKHMEGFKLLINQFTENELLTNKASKALHDYTDLLIK